MAGKTVFKTFNDRGECSCKWLSPIASDGLSQGNQSGRSWDTLISRAHSLTGKTLGQLETLAITSNLLLPNNRDRASHLHCLHRANGLTKGTERDLLKLFKCNPIRVQASGWTAHAITKGINTFTTFLVFFPFFLPFLERVYRLLL